MASGESVIVVTGAAGFIGSNLIKALNARGETNILAVDDLTDGTKFRNLVDLKIADYLDQTIFLTRLGEFGRVKVIFHQGACSSTTEWNGQFMLNNNYEYAKQLLHYCQQFQVAFIYASSAAVYGLQTDCQVNPTHERPLNVYGYSKLLFDQYVRRNANSLNGQVAGLRYFNVYGPREQHKGSMASVAWHCHQQLLKREAIRLFAESGGYANGEQRRDFIYVKDIVALNLWLMDNPQQSGIFNAGTGRSQTFNDVANAVIAWHGVGQIDYIPFPDHLKHCYQHFTQANMQSLRELGYIQTFYSVEAGVKDYLDEIAARSL